ncbi:kinase-like domain-containing protein [Lenzites betulinus]|nr:kinase-like domain-containing protein [Lenzites betulinus]
MQYGNLVLSNMSADGLFNYDVHEEVGRGAVSIVYRATCKRGRIRNRLVAIKKIARPPNDTRPASEPGMPPSLHSTLHHPSVVSLISVFDTPDAHYQVLELLQEGTLAELLCSREVSVLAEPELRAVAKSLVDALSYLKAELVLHRNINPSQILVTEQGRVKLSGFSSAIKLLTVESTVIDFCGSANYISPEILTGIPYGFGTDIWSLGCVLMTCVSGLPPFSASTPNEVYDNIYNVNYSLPDTTDPDVRDLISSLLQKNPQDRMSLHRIPSHPFFRSPLRAAPLKLCTKEKSFAPPPSSTSDSSGGRVPSPKRYPSSLCRDPTRPRPNLASYAKPKHAIPFKRMPLEDITNLYAEDPQEVNGDNLLRSPPAHRYVSHPESSIPLEPFSAVSRPDTVSRAPTPALTVDSRLSSGSSSDNVRKASLSSRAQSQMEVPCKDITLGSQSSPRSELRRVLSEGYDLPNSRRAVSLPSGRPRLYSRHTEAPIHRIWSQATSTTAVSHPRSPAKLTTVKNNALAIQSLPIPALNTHRLKPQTHKVSRGQLVVLPSRSLLVDFREGERRKGGRGKEVLVISADGLTIQAYSAPHLSTPCCLAEPSATFALPSLPQSFMSQYRDAARLVDQLKSRIPKLVHHADEAKCTLMSNGPMGDVEIVIPTEEDKSTPHEAIRLRLHRKQGTLEISRYSGRPAATGYRKDLGEWMKKIVALGPGLELSVEDKAAMDDMERLAMRHLAEFLCICRAAESV